MRRLLFVLLALNIARLWLMPLPSSLWTDETSTAYIAQRPDDPTNQIATSIYYLAPRIGQHLLGTSEIAWRLPSVLFMGIALFLIMRLASRLIHPEAAWFALFACLAIPDLNYYAADARPYALGICIAAASLWFLIKWLDSGAWIFCLLFVVFAALLWRVHLVFWAFYPVFLIYALVRRASWRQALPAAALLALALTPVALEAVKVKREAALHIVVPVPTIGLFLQTLEWKPVLVCVGSALLLSAAARWRAERTLSFGSAILILSWWLWMPVCLFVFSRASGTSLYVTRYFSLMLPGAALAATFVAALFVPPARWKQVTLALAVVVLTVNGHWTVRWPEHTAEDWRAASSFADLSADEPDTPVLIPSPFVEAAPPLWSPDYKLPGFLYAPLFVYPVRGRIYPLPIHTSGEYALNLTAGFASRRKFVLYGRHWESVPLTRWLAARPEMAEWHVTQNQFGDVMVAVFAKSL